MIGSIKESLFRFWIGNNSSALREGDLGKHIIQGRIPQTDDDNVLRTTPLVDTIHVDDGNRTLEWIQRDRCIVLCAEQTKFLSRHSEEQNRPPGRGFQARVRLGKFQESRCPARIVYGAVKDLISGERGIPTEMVPMRRI